MRSSNLWRLRVVDARSGTFRAAGGGGSYPGKRKLILGKVLARQSLWLSHHELPALRLNLSHTIMTGHNICRHVQYLL